MLMHLVLETRFRLDCFRGHLQQLKSVKLLRYMLKGYPTLSWMRVCIGVSRRCWYIYRHVMLDRAVYTCATLFQDQEMHPS